MLHQKPVDGCNGLGLKFRSVVAHLLEWDQRVLDLGKSHALLQPQLLLAESHLTRRLFGAMVGRIGALSLPAE